MYCKNANLLNFFYKLKGGDKLWSEFVFRYDKMPKTQREIQATLRWLTKRVKYFMEAFNSDNSKINELKNWLTLITG